MAIFRIFEYTNKIPGLRFLNVFITRKLKIWNRWNKKHKCLVLKDVRYFPHRIYFMFFYDLHLRTKPTTGWINIHLTAKRHILVVESLLFGDTEAIKDKNKIFYFKLSIWFADSLKQRHNDWAFILIEIHKRGLSTINNERNRIYSANLKKSKRSRRKQRKGKLETTEI